MPSQIERVKSLVLIALEMGYSLVIRSYPSFTLRADCYSTPSHAIKEDLQSVQAGIADPKVDTSTILDANPEIKSGTTTLRDDTALQQRHDLMSWICSIDYYV